MTSRPPGQPPDRNMVWIPGGTFRMGSNDFYPEERPARDATVDGFWMDKHPVTNDQFARFAKRAGYVTVAERPLNPDDYPGALPELLHPGGLVFQKTQGPVDLRDFHNWWAYVVGASWRHPRGPESTLLGRERHPVVQVAYEDAEAYAEAGGKSLPTEAEWERAARGGLAGAAFAWGNEHFPRDVAMANTWQGEFPWQNLLVDRFEETSPVGSFAANGYGLYDTTGNVWEWTSDPYRERVADTVSPCCAPADPARVGERFPRKVIKGGSHLCAPNYCLRYRPAARQSETTDTATCHIGFRCIVREADAEHAGSGPADSPG